MRGQDDMQPMRAELSSGCMTDWTHTANAATASEHAETGSRACRHGSLQLNPRGQDGMRPMRAELSGGCMTDWTHTANAATASGQGTHDRLNAYGEGREPVGMAHCG